MQYSLSTLPARSGAGWLGWLFGFFFPFERNVPLFPSRYFARGNSPCLSFVLRLLSRKWSAFPTAPVLPKVPSPVPGTGTRRNPPACSARPRPGPAHPPRKRRRRRHRVPARLRTGKLIAPAGTGERRGLGGALGGPLGPAPSGRLKRGGCPLPHLGRSGCGHRSPLLPLV